MLEFLFGFLMLATPLLLIGGWARWSKGPRLYTASAEWSFAGFVAATASAALAFVTVLVALVRPLPISHPLSLLTYAVALLLSMMSMGAGLAGIWKPGPLRWFAPLCAGGMAVFWFMIVIVQLVT